MLLHLWFRVYKEDIEYYEYQDSLNSIIILTDNELDSIILSDKGIEWFESHRLKAIIFKIPKSIGSSIE